MRRAPLFLALMLLFSAFPAFAQQTEFGVIVGGSRRFIDKDALPGPDPRDNILSSEFSFSNTSVDLYWGISLDEDTTLKLKAGSIETEVAEGFRTDPNGDLLRNDVEGEVQHLDASVEYRFSEAYGKTGLFGGVGLYRLSGEGIKSTQSFGWHIGINADFPMTRRYGFVVESAYHWTRAAHRPGYLTVGGGLRIAF
ncbi:MAG TPA: outer membrane beta-barrel protein [Thermoanaerobaculia bacterium]|nr:outer membrane beta-barrel protein [Thermoanaerobaculia bacterium]